MGSEPTPAAHIEGMSKNTTSTGTEQVITFLPEQPEDIDPNTVALPTVAGAAERVGAFLSEFGDGIVMHVEPDEHERFEPVTLYARDLEALKQLAQQPWVVNALHYQWLFENECCDSACPFHDTIGQHTTFQHTETNANGTKP